MASKTPCDLISFCATLPETCNQCKIGYFSFSNTFCYFASDILHLLKSSLILQNFSSLVCLINRKAGLADMVATSHIYGY